MSSDSFLLGTNLPVPPLNVGWGRVRNHSAILSSLYLLASLLEIVTSFWTFSPDAAVMVAHRKCLLFGQSVFLLSLVLTLYFGRHHLQQINISSFSPVIHEDHDASDTPIAESGKCCKHTHLIPDLTTKHEKAFCRRRVSRNMSIPSWTLAPRSFLAYNALN